MAHLKQLETFVRIARMGSLTAAAKAEGVVAAVVGRRLDALETRLGVKLMQRSTRSLYLTHEGSAFLENCQRILEDLSNAEASVSAEGLKAQGHLRVAAPAGFGRRHVAPLVPRFLDLHPEVQITLSLSDRVLDLAGEGYDCAVRVGDLTDSSLVHLRLADNQRLCVATPAFWRRYGYPKKPQDLLKMPCLTLSSEFSQTRNWSFLHNGELLHLRPRGPMSCSDGQVLYRWCLDGLGVAWRSVWEVQDDVKAGRLESVLNDFQAPPNGIYALFLQRRLMPLRLRLWLDFLKQHYGRPEYWSGGA